MDIDSLHFKVRWIIWGLHFLFSHISLSSIALIADSPHFRALLHEANVGLRSR